ncbi:MAG: hypothetical protein JXR31_15915 [Prolixibacteraceae bacterium]|nr:hypothetical protein [Prolixibacteraceae bacterium]MBN2775742.1 hypothetical protein [Prolixibacteraceae bacterium]
MSTKTVKLIVFIALLVHGIGHFQGVVASLGVKINNSTPATSWILKGLGGNTNKTICFILFLITGLAGILTALSFKGILLNEAMWQTLATITAVCSTICLIIFPNSFAMFFNKIGAIAVNLFIYYSVIFNGNWPAQIFED